MEATLAIANDLNLAFEEFYKCIQSLGTEKTLTALKNLRFRETNINDSIVKFVLETVTNEINISMDELISGRNWSLERTVSIGICTYVLSNYFDYSARTISLIMKKGKGTCWRNMQRFTELSHKNPDEQKLLDRYQIIEKNVKLFIKNNPL